MSPKKYKQAHLMGLTHFHGFMIHMFIKSSRPPETHYTSIPKKKEKKHRPQCFPTIEPPNFEMNNETGSSLDRTYQKARIKPGR